MKVTFVRTGVALALALGIAACGGGKATFSLTGKISGLAYTGLELINVKNGDTLDKIAVPEDPKAEMPFSMPKVVEYGDEYEVTVKTQPLNQDCTVGRGKDTAGRLDAINITVVCKTHTFTIGGTVSGLVKDAGTTASGLVITNGADRLAIEKDGTYVLPTAVAFGAPYGVAILHQPTNPARICEVKNATGTVASKKAADGTTVAGTQVDNINIECKPVTQ